MHSKVSGLRVALARQLRGRILDCGSGDDLYGRHLRQAGNEVISLDVDAQALKRTPGQGVVASCAWTPFVDDCFDAVWACAVLEHVGEDCLPELIRVTRPGGRVVAITPNRHSPFDPLKRLVGLGTWWDNPGHVRLYAAAELRPFGRVIGETWWAPGLGWLFRRAAAVAHVLILDVHVTGALKRRVRRRYPRWFAPRGLRAAAVCL
jgi:SAM-dependent methyltransferase